MDAPGLKDQLLGRIAEAPGGRVWTPTDFADLAGRDAVDKALQRLATTGELRRIDRGLYDRPARSVLTGKPTPPDYREVLDAIVRRDQARMLVDGMTAANDLGFSDAVPARVVVHTDVRRRTLHVGRLEIQFKLTAPSKLYWAGRPAMRIVQSLHWLKDTLGTDRDRIIRRVVALLADPDHGNTLRSDLAAGLPTLPAWMQDLVREAIPGGGAGTPPPPEPLATPRPAAKARRRADRADARVASRTRVKAAKRASKRKASPHAKKAASARRPRRHRS
jgi:hypothetical protein